MGSQLLRWVKARQKAVAPVRWALRLLLAVWKGARRLPVVNRWTTTVRVGRHRMRIRCFSYDDLLCASEDYEAPLAELLPPNGGVAVDAGAFIGRHTLAYAHAVGPRGRVVAAEPLPENYRQLVHNVQLNGYAQVTCVPYALGCEDGEVWLTYEAETSTASSHRRLPRRCHVPQQMLDHLLEQLGIGSIDLLKIDVEGAELEVLEGAQQILAASPRARLVIEVHDPPTPAGCPVERWLQTRGYTVQPLFDGPRRFYLALRVVVPAHIAAVE